MIVTRLPDSPTWPMTITAFASPIPIAGSKTPIHPETIAWVEAQNALTRARLDGPARDQRSSYTADEAVRLSTHECARHGAVATTSLRTTPAFRISRCSTCRTMARGRGGS